MEIPANKSMKLPGDEQRSFDQLRQHYEIERELATRLRNAPGPGRPALYGAIYDELFRRVPLHPQNTKKHNAGERQQAVAAQVRLLAPYLNANTAFLEVGCGDGALSLAVAAQVQQAYGLDVSGELTGGMAAPSNFRFLLSDGRRIPLPDGTIDVAYSYQLMEHIHPDDAVDQLREIHRVLKPAGIYVCITPNRLSGPHDISRYFDREATGLHLKEYTIRECAALFRQIGFRTVRVERMLKSVRLSAPAVIFTLIESLIETLPRRLRTPLARSPILARLLDVSVIGRRAW